MHGMGGAPWTAREGRRRVAGAAARRRELAAWGYRVVRRTVRCFQNRPTNDMPAWLPGALGSKESPAAGFFFFGAPFMFWTT